MIFKKLEISEKHIFYGLVFYAFVPTSVFFTSGILKEPFQLLFVNFAILCLVYIFVDKKKIFFIFLFINSILLALFHKILIIYSSALILLLLIFLLFRSGLLNKIIIILLMPLTIFLVYINVRNEWGFNIIFGLYEYIEAYQYGSIYARRKIM